MWVLAFKKYRLFANRFINNENTRPPSWKFKKNATQSFIIRFSRAIPRWNQNNGLYRIKNILHKFQDGRQINRKILPFHGHGRYRKYYDIFGIVWVLAFRKGRFFKNRFINNKNILPPSWKFKKNYPSVIYHPILSCDTSLDSEK